MNINRILTLIATGILFGVSAHRLAAQTSWIQYEDFVERKALTFDHAGRLWAINTDLNGHTPGIARFDGQTWRSYGVADGLLNDTLCSATIDRQGKIWVAGNKVVAYYDSSTDHWNSIPVQDSLTGVRDYLDIVCDSSGNIWAASFPKVIWQWVGSNPVYQPISEVHRWDGSSWTTFDLGILDSTGQKGSGQVYDMTIDRSGSLWVVSTMHYDGGSYYGGLHKFDGTQWTVYTIGGSKSTDPYVPLSVYSDPTNVVWIGHQTDDGRALDWFDGQSWSTNTSVRFQGGINGDPGDHHIIGDPSGRTWMMGLMPFDSNGTAYISGATGAFLFDNHHGIASEFHHSNSNSNGLIASQVNSIAFAPDGSIWFATTLGLSVLKGVQNSVTAPVPPVTPSNIQSYPNPFTQSTTIAFSSAESGAAEVSIVNLLGTQVARLFGGELAAGEHTFTWNAAGIAPGAYWGIVRMNGRVVQVPIVLKAAE